MRELTRFGLAIQRGVISGGNANNGANAGLACVNSNNAPSSTSTNYGSRHYFSLHFARTVSDSGELGIATLPLGRKSRNARNVSVGASRRLGALTKAK